MVGRTELRVTALIKVGHRTFHSSINASYFNQYGAFEVPPIGNIMSNTVTQVSDRLKWRRHSLEEKMEYLEKAQGDDPITGVRSEEHIYELKLDIMELEAQIRTLENLPSTHTPPQRLSAVIEISQDEDQFAEVRLSDGTVAMVHHNGKHMLTTYYQNRRDVCGDTWKRPVSDEELEQLASSKAYLNDWVNKQEIDGEIIQDALDWSGFYNNIL